MLCVFCGDGSEDDFWQMIWESITFISVLNDSLSVANKQQHYLLLVINSEGIYRSA